MCYYDDNDKSPNNEYLITSLRDEARMCIYNKDFS
jgi:hypothetical protein